MLRIKELEMKRLFKHIVLSSTLATAIVTNATAETLSLSLPEAIEIALSDNPTIKIAELEVERYDYVRKTTMGGLLPQFNVDGTFNRTLKNQSWAQGFEFGGDQYSTVTANGNLTLPLYSPAIYRTLRMNATEAAAAVEAARSSRIDLIAAVKSSFYDILLAERSLEVLETSAETSKQTVDETEMMYKNGLSSEYDLLTAQVQYSNLQPMILQARSSIDIAKMVFKMYLSLPESVEIEVIGDLETLRERILALSESLPHDISGNSSLKSLAISQDILSHQLRINNASRLPTLSAFGVITLTGNDMEPFSIDGSVVTSSSNYYWQRPAYAGLSISIPIFNGLSNSARSQQIKNQISQLELQKIYTEDSVAVSLSSSISTIYTAREKLFAEIKTVSQATKAYEISNTRYMAGAGTILELNSARLALTQSELNLSQAIYDLLSAKSEYDKISGVERIDE